MFIAESQLGDHWAGHQNFGNLLKGDFCAVDSQVLQIPHLGNVDTELLLMKPITVFSTELVNKFRRYVLSKVHIPLDWSKKMALVVDDNILSRAEIHKIYR